MNVLSKSFDRKRFALKLICCLFFLGLNFLSFGQEKCGTTIFNKTSVGQQSEEIKNRFERWLIENKHNTPSQMKVSGHLAATVYQIPVVVHIVHNGEAYGSKGNIPDEQIESQITTLNEDFRRMNADQSDTPADFLDVAADVEIEFVMAKRDPEGLATNGIVRVEGNQTGFTIDEAEALASNSYWPAEEYFNVWVADLKYGSGDGLLGFAKFPISNEPGMDDDPNLNRMIDGVYMDFEYFGTGYNAVSFSKGRTMTHEVGHWLGLRHIWGDGGCSVDDFCDDTPTQGGSNSGCPSEDQESCSTIDMFQNYMDYTDDVCMNLFTDCQSDRMRIVLENSPRRKELLESKGAIEPNQVSNDLGIKSIETPSFGNCDLVIEPEIEVRNYGTNDIDEFSIDLLADEELLETLTFTETLTPLQTLFVDFSSITISTDVESFSFKVNQVNGGADGNDENDCQWITTFFPEHEAVPFVEDFWDLDDWKRRNSGSNTSSWNLADAPNVTVINTAASLAYHGSSSDSFGELDYLISPVFDLSELSTADLKFKYAYSGYPDNYSDALSVVVSTDCGATFPEEQVLFREIGAELVTTSSTSSSFVPDGPSDWVELEINFNEFSGSEVVIAFIGSNGGGNNIYVDDVEIFSTAAHDYDIGIVSINELPIVSCEQSVPISFDVRNYGKQLINSFSVQYSLDSFSRSVELNGVNLEPGKTLGFEIDDIEVEEGDYEISIQLIDPNGNEDGDFTNNRATSFFAVNQNSDIIPIREKFSSAIESSDWSFIRPEAPTDWMITTFEDEFRKDYSATLNGYEIVELGIENWLVSPVLDFSSTDEASMSFDLSYANKVGRNDELKILVSIDCGESYPFEIYNKKGGELAVTQSETAWLPDTITDWREEFVHLSDFVGTSEVRLAFVVTNQNGNNLYLDNIEFYESAGPPLAFVESMKSFPNPAKEYVEVKFNFNIKEEILLRIVSLQGEVIAEKIFPNTLNQVYRLNQISSVPNGMYLLQVLGDNTKLSDKILINH
ncbi:MAG: choice-of-anchor J domain-containing protein [Reichenbachiella sp.]|uniref:T9SS-dependent choice-of-anchor J family protein n=1 Tax=Reichenbachiella sp. TaxID=2184521 RepID=UPI0032988866